jgi:hypothetical protein
MMRPCGRSVLLTRAAVDLTIGDERAQRARRVDPARPWPAAPEAVLAIFRRVDPVEADLGAGDDKAVAVDHLRGAGDIRALPPRQPARRNKPGERHRDKGEHPHVTRRPGQQRVDAVHATRCKGSVNHRVQPRLESMIPKSGHRFSEKIMLQ